MAVSRDLLIVSGGRLVTTLLGLLTTRAVTTFLTPAQYGALALLIVVQTFCGLFLINPVGMHINRHTHEWWDDGSLLSRLSGYKMYVLTVSFIGGIVAITVTIQLGMIRVAMIVLAMILMVNGATWNTTWIPLLNMVGQRSKAVIWTVITAVTGLLTSILLSTVWPTAIAWFVGQAFGMTVGAIGAGRELRQHAFSQKNVVPQPLLDRGVIITYCLPLAAGTGFMWAQLSGYRLIVEHYWGLSSLGFLSVGLLLAGQMWSLTESLAQQFLYPLFFRRIAQSDKNTASVALSDLLNVLVPVYLVLVGMTFLGAPYLLKLLIASQYTQAEIFVRLGVGIEFCRVVGNLLSNAAQVTKRTRSIVLPYASGAIALFLMLVIIGECHLGIAWVAISLLLAALVMLGGMWAAMFREIKFFLDMKRWLVAVLMMLLFILPTFWLNYPTNWTEVAVMLLIIGVLGGAVVVGLLKGSTALQRLLIVDLKSRSGTV